MMGCVGKDNFCLVLHDHEKGAFATIYFNDYKSAKDAMGRTSGESWIVGRIVALNSDALIELNKHEPIEQKRSW